MRLVYDPVREHFLKRTAEADVLIPLAVRGFEYLADRRLDMQRITYSALTYRTGKVRRWITHGDTSPSAEDWGTAVAVAVLAVAFSGYTNPYFAVPAAMMDIRNLYNYYF